MNTKMPTRPKMGEILRVAVTPEEKLALFEVAAERRTTVSEMLRRAARQLAGLEKQAA